MTIDLFLSLETRFAPVSCLEGAPRQAHAPSFLYFVFHYIYIDYFIVDWTVIKMTDLLQIFTK